MDKIVWLTDKKARKTKILCHWMRALQWKFIPRANNINQWKQRAFRWQNPIGQDFLNDIWKSGKIDQSYWLKMWDDSNFTCRYKTTNKITDLVERCLILLANIVWLTVDSRGNVSSWFHFDHNQVDAKKDRYVLLYSSKIT